MRLLSIHTSDLKKVKILYVIWVSDHCKAFEIREGKAEIKHERANQRKKER